MGFLPLASELAGERSVYGLQGLGLEPGQEPQDDVKAMASTYLQDIRSVQPSGPYLLAGWSLGGLIALEATHQLLAAGDDVAMLILFDTHLAITTLETTEIGESPALKWVASQLDLSVADLREKTVEQQWDHIAEKAATSGKKEAGDVQRLAAICRAHLRARSQYVPLVHTGAAVLFLASDAKLSHVAGWRELCPQIQVEWMPGDHYSMLSKPHVDVLANSLRQYMHLDTVSGP